MPAPMRFTERGRAECVSEASGCLCIISSATSLAARSISPMLKLILSCSRTRSPTMSRQRPNPWGEWRRCWLLPSAAEGLFDLARRLNAPVALKDIGMPPDGIERAADLAVASPYPNPRPVEREGIRALLDDAFHGRRPRRAGSSILERAHA